MTIMLCFICKKEYKGMNYSCRKTKYCSIRCMAISYTLPDKKSLCTTCKKEFKYKSSSGNKGKFCSVKCIRYQGSFDHLKGKGFWQNASEEEKLNKIRDKYFELVVKKEGCWGWKIGTLKSGYTKISTGKGSIILGHRASWIIHNGPIHDNLWILHKCDNPICTNPDHLFLGTPKQNVEDCLNKKRRVANSGTNHYHAKLTEDDVRNIRLLTSQGKSQSFLGKMFLVSPSTIQNIVDGKTWKHLQ